MPGLYIHIPAEYWQPPVATAADLPDNAPTGAVRLAIDTGVVYYYDGSAWQPMAGATDYIDAVGDTASINLTNTGGTLTADLIDSYARGLLSGSSPISYNSGSGAISIQLSTGAQNGYLSSTDWSTFNGKEPAISSGTTAQYWRGDKSFQTLNADALTVNTGVAAATGKIGEILTSSVTTATTTGVGGTGVYGNVTSISLTSGDWMVSGMVGFQENGATLTTSLSGAISSSSSGVGIGAVDAAIYNNLISSTSDMVAPVPTVNIIVPAGAPVTYYLNTRFFYTAGTPKHYGKIEARRMT